VLTDGGGVGQRRQGRDVERRGVGQYGVGRATRGWTARDQESRCHSGNVGSGGWREVGQAGRRGGRAQGEGTRGSIGRLDRWVHVMDL
jgi:hypothetical protein